MKNKFISLIIVLSLTINAFAQNQSNYEFKLIEPTKTQIHLKTTDKLPVTITFNETMVNEKSAWILTQVNGKMTGFTASTTMTSPFTDEIPASYLGPGKHEIKFLLLPPGQKTDNPFAEISLEITVEGDAKEHQKQLASIDEFVETLTKCIKTNDLKTFTSLCANKKRMDKLVSGITGNSQKDKGIKSELESEDAKKIEQRAIKKFNLLQADAKEQNIDLSKLEFIGFEEKDINLELPSFKAMDIAFRIKADQKSYTIRLKAFITNDDFFIFGFRHSSI